MGTGGDIRKKKFFLAGFLAALCAWSAFAFAPEVTGAEVAGGVKGEYNRAFFACLSGKAAGGVEFNKAFTARAGAEFGGLGLGHPYSTSQARAFLSADYVIPVRFPVSVGLSYQLNSIPQYETASHSLLPRVAVGTSRVGGEVAINCRWTSFFGEDPILEFIWSFRAFVNIIDNEKFRLGLVVANYDEFYARNSGAYFLNINSAVKLKKGISITSAVELYQSGSRHLAANFYGISCAGGVVWAL